MIRTGGMKKTASKIVKEKNRDARAAVQGNPLKGSGGGYTEIGEGTRRIILIYIYF